MPVYTYSASGINLYYKEPNMAILTDGGLNATATTQGAQQTSASENNVFGNNGAPLSQGVAGSTGSIGFSPETLYSMMSLGRGSEYTNDIAKNIEKIYKDRGIKAGVVVCDKETERFAGLAYSVIAVGTKQDNVVTYFLIMLEATGRLPLKAGDIVKALYGGAFQQQRQGQINFDLYTTDDAFDKTLQNLVAEGLIATFGSDISLRSVDGIILPYNATSSIEEISLALACIAHAACVTDAIIGIGAKGDINITVAKQQRPNVIFNIKADTTDKRTVNELGSPVSAQWKTELVLKDQLQQVNSLNQRQPEVVLTRTCGFIDAIPETRYITQPMMGQPVGFNQPQPTMTRLRPHIVITSMNTLRPTTGYLLLGLATASIMAQKNMYLGVLTPRDRNSSIGALNIFTDLNGDGRQKLDISDTKKVTPDKARAIVDMMFALESTVSFDVASYGPQTFFTSILAQAASVKESNSRQNARRDLIEAANVLTNGAFPANFDPNTIFVGSGVLVPIGTWSDKTGTRDIRDINLATIADQTGDLEKSRRWATSNMPKSLTGVDPYLTKVDILAQVVPDAEIAGKAVRVTFTSMFIKTLTDACAAAGLTTIYEPEVKLVENNNIALLGNYFANAGINNNGTVGFARENIQAGPNWRTLGSNIGWGRF